MSEPKWLPALFGALFLTGCQQRRGDLALWELEQSKIELQERLNLVEYRLHLHDGEASDEFKKVSANLGASAKRKQELQSQCDSLSDEIASLEKKTVEIEEAWVQKQRSKALGTTFDHLTTKDGRVLENASVTRIDDGGVSIRHEHGAAKLRFDDLTPEQQNLFGMIEKKADAAESRELIASAAYEKHVEQQLLASKERRSDTHNDSGTLARNARGSQAPPQEAGSSLSSNRSDNPLHQPATRVGRGRSWTSYTYDGRPSYRYYGYPYTSRSYSPYTYKRDLKQESSGMIVIPNPYTGSRTFDGN